MRVISIRKERILAVVYMLAIVWGVSRAYLYESTPAFAMPVSKKIILIDAGHGGWVP